MANRSRTIPTSPEPDVSILRLAEKQEDTRTRIAVFFVIGYLLLILLLIILSTFFALSADNAKDFLLAIGSPLGFIIGFYFKSQQ